MRQAESPTFLNRLLKGSCHPPEADSCIIYVHLHNLLSLYHGFITAVHHAATEPEHTVLKYINTVQYKIDKNPVDAGILQTCVLLDLVTMTMAC